MSLFVPCGESLAGGGAGTIIVADVDGEIPVSADGSITLVEGDDYKAADGRGIGFSSSTWPNLTGATVRFYACNLDTSVNDINAAAASATQSMSTWTVAIDLSAAQTGALTPSIKGYEYSLKATLSDGSVVTLARGQMTVLGQYATP
jgi:hypothetical protein